MGVIIAGTSAEIFGLDTSGAEFTFWILIPSQNIAHIGALALLSRFRRFPNLAEAIAFEVDASQARWVAAGAAISIPLALGAAGLRSLLGIEEEGTQAIVDAVAETGGTPTMAAVVLGVAVLGPVTEEMIHRGLLYGTITSKGASPRFAIPATAAVFSLIHLADPSLYNTAGMVTLLLLFAFGLFLGILRHRTGSLGPPIFAHSGFNLLTLVVIYFLPE